MNKWYGYLHTNGSIQVKRYLDSRDLQDCDESDFVVSYTQPFMAIDREEAISIAAGKLK